MICGAWCLQRLIPVSVTDRCPWCWSELRTSVFLLHLLGYFIYYWHSTQCCAPRDTLKRIFFETYVSVSWCVRVRSLRHFRLFALLNPWLGIDRLSVLCVFIPACAVLRRKVQLLRMFLPHWKALLVLDAPQVPVYQPPDRADYV